MSLSTSAVTAIIKDGSVHLEPTDKEGKAGGKGGALRPFQGSVEKRGERNKGWKRRWLKLQDKEVLVYAESRFSKDIMGAICLQDAIIAQDPVDPRVFKIHTCDSGATITSALKPSLFPASMPRRQQLHRPGRVFLVRTDTPQCRQLWVYRLQNRHRIADGVWSQFHAASASQQEALLLTIAPAASPLGHLVDQSAPHHRRPAAPLSQSGDPSATQKRSSLSASFEGAVSPTSPPSTSKKAFVDWLDY